MAIYGRVGQVVTIERLAVLGDVQRLDNREPDEQDLHALDAGAYVVVRDGEQERLYHLAYLKADDGISEINKAIASAESKRAGLEGRRFLINGEPMEALSFIRDNLHDEELPDWLKSMAALEVGAELRLGGGAFATVVVRRMS